VRLTLGRLVPALLALTASIALPAAASARGPTVYGALAALRAGGGVSGEAYEEDAAIYTSALRAVKRLNGTRREELGAVVANVQRMADEGDFIPSRLPAIFLTLQGNTTWWTHERLLSSGERVSLPESRIVWEHYQGEGIEIQWLGTFGEANGYWDDGHDNTALRELLEEVIPLATQRAGGIAWEYLFPFDGGAPPWTSGLSQGTAVQALARAYSRLKEPADLAAAQQALGLFKTPPPEGVRVATQAGAAYLEYTYAPKERIVNGFVQSLNGLYDYALLTGDPLGRELFEAGDAEARVEVPRYDTGAWSMYDQSVESNLNYHELLAEFLKDLCTRTSQGPPVPPAAGATAGGQTAQTGAGGTTTGAAASGGTTAGAPAATTAIAGDEIYCTTAERFTADLHTPPAIALLTRRLRTGTRGGVQLSLSKVSTVTLTVRRGGKVVWTNSALVEGGKPRLLWVTPKRPGTYTVTLRAVDLAGNAAGATGTIVLKRPARHR
jgi:D-glucuronyl C5-epimerase C-terminus